MATGKVDALKTEVFKTGVYLPAGGSATFKCPLFGYQKGNIISCTSYNSGAWRFFGTLHWQDSTKVVNAISAVGLSVSITSDNQIKISNSNGSYSVSIWVVVV